MNFKKMKQDRKEGEEIKNNMVEINISVITKM